MFQKHFQRFTESHKNEIKDTDKGVKVKERKGGVVKWKQSEEKCTSRYLSRYQRWGLKFSRQLLAAKVKREIREKKKKGNSGTRSSVSEDEHIEIRARLLLGLRPGSGVASGGFLEFSSRIGSLTLCRSVEAVLCRATSVSPKSVSSDVVSSPWDNGPAVSHYSRFFFSFFFFFDFLNVFIYL